MKKNYDAVRAQEKNSGFGFFLSSDETFDNENDIKNLIKETIDIMDRNNKITSDVWRGIYAIPPGSFIESVASNFLNNSSIPAELPTMACLSYFSSYICKNNVRLEFQGVKEHPTLWLAVLASSGAAKTFVLDYLEEILKCDINVIESTEIPTSKSFIEKIAENPLSLFIIDEMGPFFKNTKDQSYLSELPTYLLHIYTHKTIDRSVGGKQLIAEHPILNILGYSAKDSFFEDFDYKNFLTGCAQRFAWVLVDKDPEPIPTWKVRKKEIIDETQRRWYKAIDKIRQDSIYTIPDDGTAEKAFNIAYKLLNPKQELPDSFFRRMMHGAVRRYALLYHLLLGKADIPVIDEEDIAWATRLAYIHTQDTLKILSESKLGRLGGLLKKVETLKVKYQNEGKDLLTRDVVKNIWGVKTVSEAKQLMELLNIPIIERKKRGKSA